MRLGRRADLSECEIYACITNISMESGSGFCIVENV